MARPASLPESPGKTKKKRENVGKPKETWKKIRKTGKANLHNKDSSNNIQNNNDFLIVNPDNKVSLIDDEHNKDFVVFQIFFCFCTFSKFFQAFPLCSGFP